ARVLLERDEALGGGYLVRRNIEGADAVAARAGARECVEQCEYFTMLWLLAFRIEVDAQLARAGDFLADRVIMDFPRNLRSRQHQTARPRPHLVAVLADGPFHEEAVAGHVRIVGEELTRHVLSLDQAGERMVRHF